MSCYLYFTISLLKKTVCIYFIISLGNRLYIFYNFFVKGNRILFIIFNKYIYILL